MSDESGVPVARESGRPASDPRPVDPPPVEVELKYLARDRAGADGFLVAPSLGPFSAGPTVRESRCTDTYLDTADGALARAGLAARARRTVTEALLTVKATMTEAGALQRRTELEGAAGAGLDPRAWPASAARSLLLELCGDEPLVELATVRQLRRRRDLVAGETLVELSLDQVEVLDGDRVVDRFMELELELREGAEEPLLELRAILDRDRRLAPAVGSKLDRALHAAALARAGGPEAGR